MNKKTASILTAIFLLTGLAAAEFTISSTEAEFDSYPGEVQKYAVVVGNPTEDRITVLISVEGDLSEHAQFEGPRLLLDYGQERDVNFKFTLPQGVEKLEGYLVFTDGNETKKTRVEINMAEEIDHLLFVEVKPLKPSYSPGSVGTFEITIFKFGPTKKETIEVIYSLKNPSGKEIFSFSDAVTLETSIGYDYKVEFPRDSETGKYTLKVSSRFRDFETSGSALFEVEHPPNNYLSAVVPLMVIITIIILATCLKYRYDSIKERFYRSAYKPSIKRSFKSAALEMLKGGKLGNG